MTSSRESLPVVSVIVPILNAREFLHPCLDSVLAAARRYQHAEVILVDNGSTDGTYETLRAEFSQHAGVLRLEDATISAVRNFGARASLGEYLSFIDADCVIPEDYFHRAIAVFSAVDADATGSAVDLPDRPKWIERTWQVLHPIGDDRYVRYLNSGNLLIRRSVFERVGGFNESMTTGEDYELGQRLIEQGFRIYSSQDVRAKHLGNPKTLRGFVKRHAWHGEGMLQLRKTPGSGRVAAMTTAHMGLTFIAAVAMIGAPVSLLACIGLFIASQGVVPGLTVVYRAVRAHRLPPPVRSIFLYHLYYWARAYALTRALVLRRFALRPMRPGRVHPGPPAGGRASNAQRPE